MNMFVIEDDSWDNYAIMSKYISKNYLPENARIHHIYGKHLPYVNKITTDNDLNIYRRSIDDKEPKNSYNEIIKNMNICIIFHNFIEYTTPSSFVIKVCEENKIPYIIISEHSRMCFLNGEMYDGKFKGALKTAIEMGCNTVINFKFIDGIEDFKNLNNKIISERKSLNQIKKIINKSYEKIHTTRDNKSIVLVDFINSK